MLRVLAVVMAMVIAVAAVASVAYADPQSDRAALREFYSKRFPGVALEDHADGVYAIEPGAREQWLEIEDFPPYEIEVEEGGEIFTRSFGDGGTYAACFGGPAVKGNYPRFDEGRGEVVTLEIAVNDCRIAAGAQPLAYDSAELINLVTYMAYESRGLTVAVPEPQSDAALAAYENGKRIYATRRGQLNFACTSCHIQLAGNRLRAETLSASLGHVTHWPAYRFKWQEMGPLHLRFQECNSQVGAQSLPLQSRPYRDLEYFLTYMANGLQWNGPSTRK